ncbi:MAG: four helix bundle protein [Patescibacteria group bacterium]
MKITKFSDLKIWQEATKISLQIYKLSRKFPTEEKFGITSQLRRCSTSVGANIAEGFGRYHYKDKIRFFYLARGSLFESQNFILFSGELGYLDSDTTANLCKQYDNLSRRINAFIKSLKANI